MEAEEEEAAEEPGKARGSARGEASPESPGSARSQGKRHRWGFGSFATMNVF